MQKTNNSVVRSDNTNLIREVMLDCSIHTKETLAIATGLSSATCRNILLEMLKNQELLELSTGMPEGGRPPRRFQYNSRYVTFALCRIKSVPQGREFELLFVDANGKIIERVTSELLHSITPDKLANFIKCQIRNYGNLGSVAVSYPGVVLNGKTSCWGDIEELNGLTLGNILIEHLGIPVVIENDINLSAWGYHIQHKQITDLVYIGFPPDNLPGCGLISDGRLLRGTRGFAGEIIYIHDQPWAEIHKEMSKKHGIVSMLPVFLRSATALLDPFRIVIASSALSSHEETLLREKLNKMIRPEFFPELSIILDYQPDNFIGLLDFARRQFYQKGF